jgi:hypothetical protein
VIAAQPYSQTVLRGDSISFTVFATGTSPLFYQWELNGVPIDSATNAALVLYNVRSTQAGSYSALVSNLAGTATSAAALLTVLTPPSIIVQPQSLVAAAGNDVILSVVATGMQPLLYQWLFQGLTILGATNSTLVLTNVQSSNAGLYYVLVSNDAGSVYSTAASLSIPSGTRGFVVRSLPRYYSPGATFVVTLQAKPSTNTFSYAVEEQPPSGWVVQNITANGTYDVITRKIKWGLFFDNNPRTLTYEISAPTWQTGTAYFFGIGSDDGVITTTGGADSIQEPLKHPADISPADWSINLGEISAYGTAWKKGSNWAIGPNPIPVDYVTRSGYIWKNGEQYRFDASVSNAPLWWVTTQVGPFALSGVETVAEQTSTSSVVCSLSALFVPDESMTLTFWVAPTTGVSAYAVEDQVPAGWSVSNLNFVGEFDAVNNQIKWGPFFDDVPRQLTCQITPGIQAAGLFSFSGVGSFDGANILISGNRQTQDSCRLVLARPAPGGRPQLELHGRIGGEYLVEVSTNLLSWTPLLMVTNSSATVRFTDDSPVLSPQQFYRAVQPTSTR